MGFTAYAPPPGGPTAPVTPAPRPPATSGFTPYVPPQATLPPAPTFSTPLTRIASGNGADNLDYTKGSIKQAASDISSAGAQNAGPIGKDMLAHAPEFAKNIDAFKTQTIPATPTQAQGARDTATAEFLLPGDAAARGSGIATDAIKGAINPPASIIAKRTAELQKLEDSYSTIRKVTTKAQSQGINSKDLLAKTDLLHNAVDDTGTIRTKNAMSDLQDFIKPHETVVSKLLDREGVQLPLASVKASLKAAVDKSGLEGESLDAAHNKIDAEISGLERRKSPEGTIPLSKIQDAKINKYRTIDYMNPGSKIADKTIARTYKDLIQEHTKSADVEALNKELQSHFSVLSLLEKMDGKKVEGGRLGKYFARTVGAIVGSHFGPLGTIAGAEIAGRVKGAAMATKLSGKTGAALESSATMKGAMEASKQPPLMLPPGRTGITTKSVNTPIHLPAGVTDEKGVQSNKSGNLNQAQSAQTTATNIPNKVIPESMTREATKAIPPVPQPEAPKDESYLSFLKNNTGDQRGFIKLPGKKPSSKPIFLHPEDQNALIKYVDGVRLQGKPEAPKMSEDDYTAAERILNKAGVSLDQPLAKLAQIAEKLVNGDRTSKMFAGTGRRFKGETK